MMKIQNKPRLFSFAAATFLSFLILTQTTINNVYAASSEQEILITEVMPMSQNTDDSYEYIEIYNNSDRNIDMKDYKLPLQNTDITTSKVISPRGVLVICTKGSTTLESFNSFYGTTVSSDKYIALPSVNELFDNSSGADIILAKDDGTVIVRAQGNSTDFQLSKSITYSYPQTGFDMIKLGKNQNPTPGSITSNQIPQNGIRVTDVALDKYFLTMDINQTAVLSATIAPTTAVNKSVTWSSNNPSIVEVSQSGVLISKSEGTAKITVTTVDGSFSKVCTVVVVKVPVTGVNLDKNSVSLDVGKAVILTASVTPESATNKSVIWQSSNSNIVSVDSSGIVVGKAVGEAVITATTVDGNRSASCRVIVNAVNEIIPVKGVTFDKTNINLFTGKAIILEAKVSPINATNKKVSWQSNNNSVAIVDVNGVVTAKQPGTTWITATSDEGGYRAYCFVTVTDSISSYVHVNNIVLNTNILQMNKGQNRKLTATILPENASDKSIIWSIDNSSVASVDSTGNIKALNQGVAVVTAASADGKVSDRCFIFVKDSDNTEKEDFSIRLNKNFIRVKEGKFEKITPIISNEDIKNIDLIWKSDNDKIASVSQDGKVFGNKKGKATITVSTSDGKYSANCIVRVTSDKNKGFGNGNGKAKGHFKHKD